MVSEACQKTAARSSFKPEAPRHGACVLFVTEAQESYVFYVM